MPEAFSLQTPAPEAWVAEGEGFEPPVPVSRSVVFKTTAIDRSAIPPLGKVKSEK